MKNKIKPIGNYIWGETIQREEELKKDAPNIFLPDVSSRAKIGSTYSVMKVRAVGDECDLNFFKMSPFIVVPTNLIEKIKIFDQEFEMVRQQHVIGIVFFDK